MNTKKEISIFIKEGLEDEGKVISTVALRFVNQDGVFTGDYERFEGTELTDEQIIGAVQRLMAKYLPVIPKEEEHFMPAGSYESRGKFKIGPDGKFVLTK